MNYQNPYGAVPQALENSRLALRDIMADHLATKQMEANLELAKKRSDTETALVASNLDRQRMVNDMELAKMAQEQQRWQQGQQNWQQNFQLQKNESEDQRKFREQDLALKRQSEGRQARAQEAALRDVTPMPVKDVFRLYLPKIQEEDYSDVAKAAGLNLEQKVIPTALKDQEAFIVPIMEGVTYRRWKKYETLTQQETDPAKRKQYAQKTDQAFAQFKAIQDELDRLEKVKPKDTLNLFRKAQENGDPRSFEEFYRDNFDDPKNKINLARKQYQAAAQDYELRKTINSDPEAYKNELTNTINIIRQSAPADLAGIEAGMKKRAHDPNAALQYAKDWAKYLQSGQKNPGAKKSAAPEKQYELPDNFYY